MDNKMSFVGAGQMATAIASGFVNSGKVQGAQISAFDPSEKNAANFRDKVVNATTKANNIESIADADIVFIATKPQIMDIVFAELAGQFSDNQLVVSIAAGVSIHTLQNGFQTQNVVRVMPNTPCLVGKGAIGYSAASVVTPEQKTNIKSLLSTVGICYEVTEMQLNALTALSGSGPAYVFEIIEALSDGAVRMGLPREMSTQLAAQTLLGAATMVLETGQHPGELKDQVTSPGGTTIAGLYAMEKGAVRAALMSAVEAATLKSIELGSK